MTLPMYMLAMTPQKTSGCWLISSGPGLIPWIMRAPIRTAVAGVNGNAERQQRDHGAAGGGVVGGLGSGHALDGALAELLRRASTSFLSTA